MIKKKTKNHVNLLILNCLILAQMFFLSACTASVTFQNINTSGEAQDLVDNDDEVKADISPSFSAPILK